MRPIPIVKRVARQTLENKSREGVHFPLEDFYYLIAKYRFFSLTMIICSVVCHKILIL